MDKTPESGGGGMSVAEKAAMFAAAAGAQAPRPRKASAALPAPPRPDHLRPPVAPKPRLETTFAADQSSPKTAEIVDGESFDFGALRQRFASPTQPSAQDAFRTEADTSEANHLPQPSSTPALHPSTSAEAVASPSSSGRVRAPPLLPPKKPSLASRALESHRERSLSPQHAFNTSVEEALEEIAAEPCTARSSGVEEPCPVQPGQSEREPRSVGRPPQPPAKPGSSGTLTKPPTPHKAPSPGRPPSIPSASGQQKAFRERLGELLLGPPQDTPRGSVSEDADPDKTPTAERNFANSLAMPPSGQRRPSMSSAGDRASAFSALMQDIDADPGMSEAFKLSRSVQARLAAEASVQGQRRAANRAIPDGVGRLRDAKGQDSAPPPVRAAAPSGATSSTASTDDSESVSSSLPSQPPTETECGQKTDSGLGSEAADLFSAAVSEPSEDLEPGEAGEEAPEAEEERKLSRAEKLFKLVEEFHSNEERYLSTVTDLSETFPKFIRRVDQQLYGGALLSAETRKATAEIEKHLLSLRPTHEQLEAQFRAIRDAWDRDDPNLAQVFTPYAYALKSSGPFLGVKTTLVDALLSASVKSPNFASALAEFESHYLNKLRLPDQLNTVHQQVCRYPLLLQAYIKYLPAESAELPRAEAAKALVERVVAELEGNLADGDVAKRASSLMKRLDGKFEVLEPGRRLLKDGPVEKEGRKERSQRYLILFTDVLLYCKPKPLGAAKDGLSIALRLPLDASFSVGLHEHGAQEEFRSHFVLRSQQRSLIFVGKSVVERNDWVSALNRALSERQSHGRMEAAGPARRKQSRKPSSVGPERAPVMVPDSEVTMCQVCSAKFTILNRRHHCRRCGRVICGACEGKAWLFVPPRPPALEKVCPDCYPLLEARVASGELMKEAYEFCRESGHDLRTFLAAEVSRESMRPPLRLNRRDSRRDSVAPDGEASRDESEDGEERVEGFVEMAVGKGWRRVWLRTQGGMLFRFDAPKDARPAFQTMLLGAELKEDEVRGEAEEDLVEFALCRWNKYTGTEARDAVFRARYGRDADRWRAALEREIGVH